MNKITGKVLIFTDLHCGLAGNKLSRLNICKEVVNFIVKTIETEKISSVIFGGDWFHQRAQLDGNTINVALSLMEKLAAACPVYLCVGNHDAYFKNTVDVNSVNIFRSMNNVHVVDRPLPVLINGKTCLLVPWLTDFSAFQPEQFDMAIGHFDISSRFLTKQYFDEHSAVEKADAGTLAEIDICQTNNNDNHVGDFIEIVKRGGIIFAGHIHTRREFNSKDRKFIFIGSPYQQNFGDTGDDRGFYILDPNGKYQFKPINSVPKHVRVLISEAVSGTFDFKTVRNAIVQRIYDVDISRTDETSIQVKIEEQSPYEEIVPEYIVKPTSETSDDNSSFSVNAIRKSKLDYIKGYINSIDQSVLDEKNLDRDRLFSIMKLYYENVSKEQ